jgi:glycosyltransferase involved in cell wall biosynthesis
MTRTMTTPSDITAVVPAYQAEAFLAETLATVASQSEVPFELIVVDDGSTDGTCDVVESFTKAHLQIPVRLLRQPHRGPGATRNAGVWAARSEWIAFLDSDDLWHPEKLARLADAIRSNPTANLYCHNEIARGLDGSEQEVDYSVGFRHDKPVSTQLYRRNYFSTSAVICRRELVLRWGGFDETLTSAQDYELWLRMSPDLVPIFVRETLGTYVLREGNISTTRYWRRLLNLWNVKHRHRAKGSVALFVYLALRDTLVHIAVPLRNGIRLLPKRRTVKR